MRQERAELLTVLAPLGAYRRDLTRLGVPRLSPDDGRWIAAVVALSHVTPEEIPDREGYLAALTALLDAASEGLAPPPLDSPTRPSPPPLRQARMLAERFEESSAWHLALSVLAIAERELSPDALDAGRIRAQRARIQWKGGALEDAEGSYRELIRTGRKTNEPELLARGYVGLATVSQVRGNYPAVERWAKRAATIARKASLSGLDAIAHQLLMVSAGQRGDYLRAIANGWTAFETAHGEPVREAEMLLNLSQLLVTVGEHRAALAGFVAALERDPPARIALPAWGGVATSASHLGDHRITRHAAERIQQVASSPGLQYARASALAEAAVALERIHLDGASWRRAALALADEYRFNEISYRLTSPTTSDPRDGVRRAAAPDRSPGRRPVPAPTAVITAVGALVDVHSSRVLV
jgi:tetratricopeptide (TPR) repeat protein